MNAPERMDEETRALLRRIVESFGWRQLASIDNLGHSLKFVTEFDTKVRVVAELDLSLRLFREVRSFYAELGWKDLESAVRDRVRRVPLPESRLEFGLAYYVAGIAERCAMSAYVASAVPQFAAIARSYVEAAARRPEPTRFVEFCADPTNRPQAQQFVDRWVGVARRSFGRAGSPLDARVVELGLRSRSSADMEADFFAELRPLMARTGLAVPKVARGASG